MLRDFVDYGKHCKCTHDQILAHQDRSLNLDRGPNAPNCDEYDEGHVDGCRDPDDNGGERRARTEDAKQVAAGERDVSYVDNESDSYRKHPNCEPNGGLYDPPNPDIRCSCVGPPSIESGIADGDK